MNRVAYDSRKYQIFFDKKEKDLEEKFAEFGFKIEEIQTNQAELFGKANSDDALVVYYFMKSITAKIEILDNRQHPEVFIFPKPPCCFYLKQKTIRVRIINCYTVLTLLRYSMKPVTLIIQNLSLQTCSTISKNLREK